MFSTFTYQERQLLNSNFRYEGMFYSVRYSIDSKIKKSKDEILDFLESKSVSYLVNNEGYIIEL